MRWVRYCAVVLLGILLLLPSRTEAASTVRVLTYNIHHCEGQDKKLDLERIARIITSSKADVVCLQEVDKELKRSNKLDVARVLAEQLDMTFRFGVNYRFAGGEYGTAILSRWPIVSTENHALPTPKKEEPRGCLEVVLDIDGQQVQVLCTHWGLTSEQRADHGKATVALVKEGPVIVAGDFNEGVDGEGVQALLKELSHSYGGDALPKTYPTPEARGLIDFIFYKGMMLTHEAQVLDTAESRVASDHFPVVAEFVLE